MNISFRSIRILGFSIVSILILISGLFFYSFIKKNTAILDEIVSVKEVKHKAMMSFSQMIMECRNNTHYVFGSKDNFFAPVFLDIHRILKKSNEIKKLFSDKYELDLINEIIKNLKYFRQSLIIYNSEINFGYKGGESALEMRKIAIISIDRSVDQVWELTKSIELNIRSDNIIMLNRAIDYEKKFSFALIFIIVLIILLFVMMSRGLARPINKLVEATNRISRGDLSVKIDEISKDEIGNLSHSFNSMVNDLREAREILIEEKKYVHSVIINMNDALFVMDKNSIIKTVNKALFDMLGYNENELIGKSSSVIFTKEVEFDSIEKCVCLLSEDLKIIKINKRFKEIYKYRENDVIGKYCYEVLRDSSSICSKSQDRCQVLGVLTKNEPDPKTCIYFNGEGKECSVSVIVIPINGKNQKYYLHLSEKTTDAKEKKIFKAEDLENIRKIKMDVENFITDYDDEKIFQDNLVPKFDKKGMAKEAEVFFRSKSGERIPVSFSTSVIRGNNNIINGVVCVAKDMRDIRNFVFEMKKLSSALEQSINLVFITDINGNIEYVNTRFEEVSGYKKEEMKGKISNIYIFGDKKKSEIEDLWKTINSGRSWRGVSKNRKVNGIDYWCDTLVSPIINEKKEITNFLIVQEDITKRRLNEEKTKYAATHDVLTGLFNRKEFMKRVDEWILSSKKENTGVFLLLNVDGIRIINDTYGHKIGDEYLLGIAKLLEKHISVLNKQKYNKSGNELIIGCIGGDEFVIFIPLENEDEAEKITEHIRLEVEKAWFTDFSINSTISIGGALYPEYGDGVKDLLRKADVSMFLAKKAGGNKYHFFSPKDKELEKMHSRYEWKENIKDALKEDRFEPWFQPIKNLKTDKIQIYEALVRMKDENGNILMPGSFIEVAENFGLISQIDEKIIIKVIKLLQKEDVKKKGIAISVNLSGKDLEDEQFLDNIKSELSIANIVPGSLIFEVTESAAIENIDRASKFIKEINSLGFKFALDDFGSGFTSFSYLKDLHVGYIKIDGSFIKNLHQSSQNQFIVKAIKDIADGFGIKTIAEFVEYKETEKILKELKIDYAQGYLISKPLPELYLS